MTNENKMEIDQSNKKKTDTVKEPVLASPKKEKDKTPSTIPQKSEITSTTSTKTEPTSKTDSDANSNVTTQKTTTTSNSSTTNSKNDSNNKKEIEMKSTSNTNDKSPKTTTTKTTTNTNTTTPPTTTTTTTKDVVMTDAKDNNLKSIDREKVCPFLLRVFCKKSVHHRIEEFTLTRQPVEDELQIYTWKDASLRELASLLAEADPKYAQHGSSISFKAVYLDGARGRFQSKDLGVINISKASKNDKITLEDNRFVIGDFLDVALQSYSDTRRGYTFERNEGNSGFGGNRQGNGNSGRFGGLRNNGGMNGNGMGFNNDRKRKDRIGERRDHFSSRNFNNQRDDRRGNFRSDRLR